MAEFDVKKALEQHIKVIELIKEECNKNWIIFYTLNYFRSWNVINETETTTFTNRTSLHKYDERFIKELLEKDFNKDTNDE